MRHVAASLFASHPIGETLFCISLYCTYVPRSSWSTNSHLSILHNYNNTFLLNRDAWRAYWSPYESLGYYLAVNPILARPRSRGTVRLDLNNPTGPPLIDPRYLSDPTDFEAMLNVTRFTVNTLRTYPMPYTTLFPPIPVCSKCNAYCEDYLRCHIRQLARSYSNFVGTARMGLSGDPLAVVDPNFRVIGFQNLRVVDASVIPEIPNAHTNAAVIMLAEMAARNIMTG